MISPSICPAELPELLVNSGLPGIGIRPQRPSDIDFLRELYVQNRWSELAPTDWTDDDKMAFLLGQFALQTIHYRRHYPGAAWGIVTALGVSSGRMGLHQTSHELRIIDILLTPLSRGKGVGTHLIRSVQEKARSLVLPVTLHVEPSNPARRLYRRLGFVEISSDAARCLMKWR